MRLATIGLARATFDTELAQSTFEAMLRAIDSAGHEVLGPRELCLEESDAIVRVAAALKQQPDAILLLQATFTDAGAVSEIAGSTDLPLLIWAVPEPRAGGRLRLNSFCGLNLASHALSLRSRNFGWIYCNPSDANAICELNELLAGKRESGRLEPEPLPAKPAEDSAVTILRDCRVARIGQHPRGFDTCACDTAALKRRFGVEVDKLELEDLFRASRNSNHVRLDELVSQAQQSLSDIGKLSSEAVRKSLALQAGLERIRKEGNYDAFALRCWPEVFTEYGAAICAPAGSMSEGKIPCACESDLLGAVSQLLLQRIAGDAVFLTDLVDFDCRDDSGVVWHCGQAPVSMREPSSRVTATVHSNRRLPLLREFPLKAGTITMMRISQSFGRLSLVTCRGEMLRRPQAFSGTSGVFRLERPISEALPRFIASGLEHHVVLAYGDWSQELRSVAGSLDLPLLEI